MTLIQLFATLGAAGLGFVLGWTLYFANRGKSGALSTSDLAAIAGVVAGSAVAALIGDVGGPDAPKALVFGGYGIGLFLGFGTYFLLVRASTDADGGAEALRHGRLPTPRASALLDPLEFRAASPTDVRAPSPDRNPLIDELEALRDALEAYQFELAGHVRPLRDAGRDADADAVRRELRALDEVQKDIATRLATAHLTQPAMIAFQAALEEETARLNEEAARMRRITGAIEKAADVIGAANRLLDQIKRLV